VETIDLSKYRSIITNTTPVRKMGEVKRITGALIEGSEPAAPLGSICSIHSKSRQISMEAQIVGFRDKRTLLMPLEDIAGIEPGSLIESRDESPTFKVSQEILGRVIDGNGRPIGIKTQGACFSGNETKNPGGP
jgi:flagellum-specific ATP synthase